MTSNFRCVIFAAVSSRPQAVEKESIPSQVENARALIQRRGWQETAEPLIVPGESRDIDFLHEAMEEVQAINRLIELARTHAIDLVIVRDYDRLARTRSLLTQISAYLNRCQVQIYALNKPVEPISPEELVKVGQASMTAATVEAFAGLEAQREVERLRERSRFGKDGIAKKGQWKNVTPPYGYTREIHTDDGNVVYLDVPRIVPEKVAIIHRIEELYLAGQSMGGIATLLNLEGVPTMLAPGWSARMITNMLHNPFYSGWIVWGIKRNQKVYDPKLSRFVTRSVSIPAYEALLSSLPRHPNLDDFLTHREALVADGAVIEKGLHEPIRTEERQRQLDREIEVRIRGGGRASSLSAEYPRLFSGLIKCAECGSMMFPQVNKDRIVYYRCPHFRVGICTSGASVREDRLLKDVVAVIQNFLTPGVIDTYLQTKAVQDVAVVQDAIQSTTQALKAIDSRRARWDDAYAGGVIDLEAYAKKLAEVETERNTLQTTLAGLRAQLAANQDNTKRRERLLQAAESFPTLTDDNRPLVKRLLRSLIERIVVRNKKIEGIDLV